MRDAAFKQLCRLSCGLCVRYTPPKAQAQVGPVPPPGCWRIVAAALQLPLAGRCAAEMAPRACSDAPQRQGCVAAHRHLALTLTSTVAAAAAGD
jgi:hypothetical protein